ncbi:MAG: VCBS domain-containing protein [Hyphomicrobiaceae bacterium]
MAIINGSAGNDTISTTVNTATSNAPGTLATAGDDTINGGGGNDNLSAGSGNDTITGGGGDDTINGQTNGLLGGDTAVFSGPWRDYTVTFDTLTGTYTVLDSVPGRDGRDTLTNIEKVQFSDVTLNIAQAVNVAPSIVSEDPRAATEDEPLVLTPASLVSDANAGLGDTIAITFPVSPAPVNGTVSLNAFGDVVFTPTPNASGTGSFTYTATDAKGLSVTQTVTVNIAPVNDAPEISGDATPLHGTTEDGDDVTGTVAATDIDLDDTQEFSAGEASHGTATVDSETGEYTYTPDADFAGTDSFDVTVTDSEGGTAVATITIDVAPEAEAPSLALGAKGGGGGGGGGGGARQVAVFDNGSYVDTGNNFRAESDNIQASLTSLGHTVTTFTGFDAGSITAALAGKSVLVIPELENGNLAGALDAAARSVIATFVQNGGVLIINGEYDSNDESLLNSVFGFSIASGSASGPYSLNAIAAAGTAFADDSATIPYANGTYPIAISSLPAGSSSIYGNGSGSVVSMIPHGTGQIIHLGFDWYDAAPVGLQNGGWLGVLDSAISSSAPVISTDVTGAEDAEAISIGTIAAASSDPSETVALRLTGFPEGATFSVGASDGEGGWLIPSASVAALATTALTMTPPLNYNGSFTLTVTATSTDTAMLTTGSASDSASTSSTLSVVITPVNDAPEANADTATVHEDLFDDTGMSAVPILPSTGNVLTGAGADTDIDAGDTRTVTLANGLEVGTSIALEFDAGLGVLGHIVFAADGTWTFTPTANALGGGDGPFTQEITYTIEDEEGATSSSTLTLTLSGENDVPVITVAEEGAQFPSAVVEDSLEDFSATGQLAIDDADQGESFFREAGGISSNPSLEGAYGTLSINRFGEWTYLLDSDHEDVQALGEGENLSDQVTVQAYDGTEYVLEVLIRGSNDTVTITAELAGGTVADTSEDDTESLASLTGDLSDAIEDIDGDDEHSFAITGEDVVVDEESGYTQLEGAYGTLTVMTDGTYEYVPHAKAVNGLQSGSDTDVFTVEVDDGTDQASTTLTFTITGANDTPEITATVGEPVLADSDVTDTFDDITGTIAVDDRDSDADLTVSIVEGTTGSDEGGDYTTIAGDLGTLFVYADGTYRYEPDDAAINALKDDASDEFDVQVSDGVGPAVASTLTINVTGVNDIPTLAAVVEVELNEGEVVSGTIAGSDADGDTLTYALLAPAPIGLEFNEDGSWEFDASSYTWLANEAQLTFSLAYTTNDGTETSESGLLNFTIYGTNNAPTVTPLTATAVESVLSASVNGLLGATNGGDGGALGVVLPEEDLPAGVTFDAMTNTFTLDAMDPAFNSLPGGNLYPVTVNYGVSDGIDVTPNTITFTVVGTNDGAVIGGTAFGLMTEDVFGFPPRPEAGPQLEPEGDTIPGDDTTTQVLTVGSSVSGTIAPSTDEDRFSIELTAGTTYRFNLDGSGDTPLGDTYLYLYDAEGTLLVQNDDSNSSLNSQITFTAPADGTYYLGAKSYNTAYVGTYQLSAVEASTEYSVSGVLNVTDADSEQNVLVAFDEEEGDNGYGTFTVQANGAWTYILDNEMSAVQALGNGQTLIDRITVTSLDGSDTQVITVLIQGANDAPVVAEAEPMAVTEDTGVFAVNLLSSLSVTDAEGQALHIEGVRFMVPGAMEEDEEDGLLSVGPAPTPSMPFYMVGDTLMVNTDASNIDVYGGEMVALTLTYEVVDAQGGATTVTRTLTFTGANDAPVVSAPIMDVEPVSEAGSTSEGSVVTISALLNVSDADTHPDGEGIDGVLEDLHVVEPLETPAGVAFDAETQTFTVDGGDEAFDSLESGEIRVIVVNYFVTDGASEPVPHQVTFTVIGDNDAPRVTGSVEAIAFEDTGLASVNLLAGASDVDGGTLTVVAPTITALFYNGEEIPGHSLLGPVPAQWMIGNNLVIDTDDSDIDLPAGDEAQFTITYMIDDGNGGQTEQTAYVTIVGVNDAPYIIDNQQSAVTEGDGLVGLDVLSTIHDEDYEDELRVVSVDAAAAPGVVLDEETGGVSIDTDNAAYDALKAGETKIVAFNYTVEDEDEASVTHTAYVTVTGVNDSPTNITLIGANEAGAMSLPEHTPGLFGRLTTADADDAAFTYSIVGGSGAGKFSLGGVNGDQILIESHTVLDLERDGGGPFTLIVRSTDSHGASTERTFALSISDVTPDNLFGTGQSDVMHGGSAGDIIHGFGGDDTLVGNGGADQLYGGAGADGLIGGTGNDTISGGDGEDWVVGGDGADGINGDGGNDVIYGNAGEDWIIGGAGGDFIDGGADGDVIYGNEGADGVFGGAGVDFIVGGAGNDTLLGQGDADGLFGGADNDYLDGGDGNDTILGEDGGDILVGGAGVDSIDGGAGNDSIRGGLGLDLLTGGAGSDTFAFEDGDSVAGSGDFIQDWQNGTDFIDLNGIAAVDALGDLVFTQSGSSVVITGDGLELVVTNASTGDFDAADFYFHPAA